MSSLSVRIATRIMLEDGTRTAELSLPRSRYDALPTGKRPFDWATPAPDRGRTPVPWRTSDKDSALAWLRSLFPDFGDLYTDYHSEHRGKQSIWVGLRDNRDHLLHADRIETMVGKLKKLGFPFVADRDRTYVLLLDDLRKYAAGKGYQDEGEPPVRGLMTDYGPFPRR